MSTREEMRRELKDLARMATKMTGGRAISSLPSHADRRVASAVIESSAAAPPAASVLPAPLARSVAIQTPPAMVLPAAAPSRSDASPEALHEEERRERRGGLLAVLAGLGLAVAMVGGLAAGRWLAEGGTSTSSGDAPFARLAGAGPPAETPLPPAPPASVVAVVDPSSIAPASPGPMAPIVIASTRVASFAAPPRRPIPHFGTAKPASSAGVESRAPAAHESLEDLMRRSVSTQAQSGKR